MYTMHPLNIKMSIYIFLTIEVIVRCNGGFSAGRIQEGMFEYGDINGWMTPKEGADLCENDYKCAGFTFNGVLITDELFDLYFFSYVKDILLSPGSTVHWIWTSYTVSRNFVLIPGIMAGYDFSANPTVDLDFNILEKPEAAEKLCQEMSNCAGLSQGGGSMAVVLESIYFWSKVPQLNWTSMVSLRAKGNQIFDQNAMDFNRCCPENPEIDLSNQKIPNKIERSSCKISKQSFIDTYVRKRVPVILKGCLKKSWFPNPRNNYDQKFDGLGFDEILERLFNRGNDTSTIVSRPILRRRVIDELRKNNFKIDYLQAEQLYTDTMTSTENLQTPPSFTHDRTPNDAHHKYKDMMEHRRAGSIRVFLKLSNLKSRLDCYQRYRRPNTHKLLEGHEKCLVLDGFWKPPPMPDDLYSFTKYDNDLAWIIMSAMHTGSQLHIDPDHMGAWNLLLTGRKWWTVIPYQAKTSEFTCDRACSHRSWGDGSNSYMWFNHVLPQIRDKRFYGKNVLEFVQEPGDVLYLPTGMPHSIFNIDDNVALTENYLFPDGIPFLVRSMTVNAINPFVPSWNETMAYKTLYNQHANASDRKKMRKTYEILSKLTRKYLSVCR